MPAELPRLNGPTAASRRRARYLERARPADSDRSRRAPRSTSTRAAPGTMTLSNGVEVRLGRRDVDARSTLFVDVVADVIAARAGDIDYVDMRYSNGFTIGWNWRNAPASRPDGKDMRSGCAIANV